MRRLVLLLAVVSLCSAPAGAQLRGPDLEKGISPEKTYDYSGLDAINLFNGSMTLPIALGPSYSVGPLSYRFTLVYTGNNWQLETNSWWSNDINGHLTVEQFENHYEPFASARRDGSIDVGLGWQLTLGRENTGLSVGASEPGHQFHEALFPDAHVDPNPQVDYTNDMSFQRRRFDVVCDPNAVVPPGELPDTSCFEIDFTDGSVHKYDEWGELLEMRGPVPSASTGAHPYVVTVTRVKDSSGNTTQLQVRDTYDRIHKFNMQPMASVAGHWHPSSPGDDNLGSFNQPDHYDVLTEAKLAAFDLPGGAARADEVATYTFSYADGDLSNAVLDAAPISRRTAPSQDCAVPVQAHVPLLERITQPDGLDYEMGYDRGDGVNWSRAEPVLSFQTCNAEVRGFSSNLTSLTVPTGGSFEWDYRIWDFPRGYNGARCPGITTELKPCGSTPMDSVGVAERRAKDTNGTLLSKREYSSVFYSIQGIPQSHHTQITTVVEHEKNPVTSAWSPAFTTLNYYSVGTLQTADQTGVIPEEYGLPFTRFPDTDPVVSRRVPELDPNGPLTGRGQRFLSSKTLDAAGALKRYTYVAYESDKAKNDLASNRRVMGESTYDKDSSTYVYTERSGYDGVGHYRTTASGSNIPSTPVKTSVVDYAGISLIGGTMGVRYDPLTPAASWITSPFSSTKVYQGSSETPAIYAEYCYGTPDILNPGRLIDGQLLFRKRLRRSLLGAQSADDVVIVYTYDTRGNVTTEKFYGGDRRDGETGGVGSGALCTLSNLGTLDYQLNYTHVDPSTNQWTATSSYTGATFKIADVTVDPNTGLVAQGRDTAGVVTNYTYDRMGRLTRIAPTGRAAAVYTYPSLSNNMTLEVKREGTTSEPMPRSVFAFDGLGRVITETESMPGTGNTSPRATTYDSLGRRASVSELGNTSAKTEFQYDIFGRLKSTKLPDGSLTEWTYEGNWKTTRKNKIWTGSADTLVTTTEEYDGHGRLVAVVEPSGHTSAADKTGDDVRTEYMYGPGDQLLNVRMNVDGVMQERTFDYDGRGFLRWESQPESGATTYRYDARGHVLTKRGDTPSQFDLDYEYDAAERLLSVTGRDPWTSPTAWHPLKEFTYGTSNSGTNLRLGKLTLARRYNYMPDLVSTYVIEDTYEYKDSPGRRTGRTTTIKLDDEELKTITTTLSYTELDLPKITAYPMAVGAGFPPPATAGEVDRSSMTRTYDRGRITSIAGFTLASQKITYWPNGMRNQLPHANGVVDTQTTGLMARPQEIGFQTYDRCVAPKFVLQPGNDTSSGPADTVQLQTTVSGLRPLFYRWYDDSGMIGEGSVTTGTGNAIISINVSPDVTTPYMVQVENDCGSIESEEAVVTVDDPCIPPEIEKIEPVRQVDGSFVLTPTFTADETREFTWTKGSSPTVIGIDETLHVDDLTETETFHLEVSDDCGVATKSVEIVILKPMPAAGLVATLNSSQTQVSLTWPTVIGAIDYIVQRRSGSIWVALSPRPTTNSFTDTTVQAGRTYAYRVQATNRTGWTDSDLATTGTFANATAGQQVAANVATAMLAALNSMRTAAGLTTLTWQMMLPAAEPPATAGNLFTQRHLLALRSRVNEVRQILGASPRTWTDPDLSVVHAKAIHWQEVLLGAQ